ncbi:MAG: amino acid permease [Gemmatimonadetes bacterium]|nr:amino acid permease [Gemmatimonadota bacterium]MBK9408392.1 amino acid permease [Gemmatimonadota bacterium]
MPEATHELRRELGVFSAALLVVGGIIGSGIFFTPAEVARALPNAATIIAVWVLGGFLALAGALTYAELGAMLPDAGGPYVYIRHAFGSLPAFLYGWMALLSIASGAIAAVAMGFAGYLARFVDLAPVGGPIGVAAATIVLLSLTNVLGIRPGAALQNLLTGAKILALSALVVGGLALWVRMGAPLPVPDAPPPRESLVAGFAAAFVAVLFTIGGWQQMNMVAGEIRDPERTIPRALLIGILIVVAIYLGANAVYLRALGRDGLAASAAVAADAASRMVGPAGATFISISAMISILGFVNVAILANSRLPYALARDGVFFEAVGRVHPRFGTPHVAILLCGGWALVLLFATKGAIGSLLSGVVFADWIFFGLGAASVFALRRQMPNARRPYRAWGYPIVPAIFVVAAAGGVLSAYVAAPVTSLAGTAMLVIGVFVHRWFSNRIDRDSR